MPGLTDAAPQKRRTSVRFAAFTLTALVVSTACSSSDEPDVEAIVEQDEFAGLVEADVRQIVEGDDSSYDSAEERQAAHQQFALGWSGCRATFEVYEKWVRTGELDPVPSAVPSGVPVSADMRATVQTFIDDLYAPMQRGDRVAAREALLAPTQCGDVPVNTEGDRSATIADAMAEL